MFRCNKEKQSCCAPKSAIQKRKNQINTPRNDTVYSNHFYHHDPYEHPSVYGQPHLSYHQPHDGPNYHRPSYITQPPLQPPPPPPPHLREHEHYQSPSEHNVPSPPLFENAWLDNLSTEEKAPQSFSHYRPPSALSPERPQPEQPTYPYSPHSKTPFYKPDFAYQQNQSATYSPIITTPSTMLTTSEGS